MTDSQWLAFVDRLAAERRVFGSGRPVRALAEEFIRRALALLFPQFAGVDEDGGLDVRTDAERVEQVLGMAIESLVPDAPTVVRAFLERLPAVHELLLTDAQAIHAGDPAAESLDEVILAYPGFLATAVHRLAHELYVLKVPLAPRLVSEWAHRETGIDIHPGAQIGASFAIDHGTGIVIGETSVIGERVKVYQGVTLGALAVSKHLANRKRHPTVGDDAVIYANATILGGNTVVGAGSIIGGNVWLTASVPPRSVVQFNSTVAQRPADDGLEFHI
ncbi:MAG: serine O-acetyltransferase [Gemmatimonas sp.]